MDDLATAAVLFVLLLIVIALVVDGLVWLVAHTWPFLLLSAAITGAAFIFCYIKKKHQASEVYQRAQLDQARVNAEQEVSAAFDDTITKMHNLKQGH